ncbi:Haloalkane dehalogenase 2 [hydrothermal vent metagenome]|uniref:Haloalkane dehalogenase 2 n=1 Tax=hydrothermal vent metagenome TaxID=652676 RepID=A0A3B0XAU7_9ZZZZ
MKIKESSRSNSSVEVNTDSSRFEIDKTLFPCASHYIHLRNGARIHYVDEGEGPVLLLLHGNPTWSFLYRHIIAELRDNFRIIAPDYPGFGLSSAPPKYGFTAAEQAEAMTAFVEHLDLEGITMMVQDWGGPIGFAIAERYPERFDRFIIGNTWAWPLERSGQKAFSTLMGGWPGQFAAWCCNGVLHFFMSKGMEKDLSDAEMAMYLAPFKERAARTPTHVFPAQLLDADAFLQKVYNNLSRLADRPVLIVWGLEDFAFQEPERDRFRKLFADHQSVLLENAGHFIQEDAPEEITRAILAWYPSKGNKQSTSRGEHHE